MRTISLNLITVVTIVGSICAVFLGGFRSVSADLVSNEDFKVSNEESSCWKVKVVRVNEDKIVASTSSLILEIAQKADLHDCCGAGYRPWVFLKSSKNKLLLKYPLGIPDEIGATSDSRVPLAKVYESNGSDRPFTLQIKCD